DVTIEMPDKVEFASVWQHLKVYSIYQNKIADDPFSYNTISDMFSNLGDTLKGDMYTWYVNHDFSNYTPNWLAKSSSTDVIVRRLTDSCCLLKIPTFMDERGKSAVYEQFKSVLSTVANYRNIIVDLRNNTGGDLLTTDYVIEDMIPAGVSYIRTKERVLNPNSQGGTTVDSVWYTKRAVRSELLNKKFAVLVNGLTASASEVLALALKDGLGAPMFGEKTYGKGIGQIHIQRRDRPWIRITCMHFYRINGSVDYHRVGFSPDTPSEQLVSEGATDVDDKYIYYAVKTLQPSVQKGQITYPSMDNSAPAENIGGMYKFADELEYSE
ncbi:MAG: S41 family peptidase, partial [Fibrobacterota bacterium]